jgi:metallo-beta-lactamase family protein
MLAGLGSALLVHGEPEAARGLATALEAAGLAGARIAVPDLDQQFSLEFMDGRWTAAPRDAGAPRLAPPQAKAPRDWHNDYAQALLDLRAALNRAPDDHSRQRLLQKLKGLLSPPD